MRQLPNQLIPLLGALERSAGAPPLGEQPTSPYVSRRPSLRARQASPPINHRLPCPQPSPPIALVLQTQIRLNWTISAGSVSRQNRPTSFIHVGACYAIVAIILDRFSKAADLVLAGRIEPCADLRLSEDDPIDNRSLVPLQRATRVGVLAVTGDPLHWGHINSALTAIGLYQLDTVVFICQGLGNYKRGMSERELRHEMVRLGIQDLFPLLRYSPIGYDNNLLGESNVFELFRLNPGRDLTVHYIVGSEKVARVVADLTDLTVRYAFKLAASAHNEFSVAVINRGAPDGPVEVDRGLVKVLVADSETELSVSSTAVRQSQIDRACPRRVSDFFEGARLYGRS